MRDEMREYRIECAAGYMDRIRGLHVRCATLEAEIADLRARAEGLGAIDYTRERVAHTVPTDRAAKTAAKLFEALDDYVDSLEGYEEERERARSWIDDLDDDVERAVVTRRYILGWRWSRIADSLGYSRPHIYRIRDDALDHLYDIMPPAARGWLPEAW